MLKSRLNRAGRAGTALAAAGLIATGLSLAGAAAAQAQALPFASLPPFTGLGDPTGIAVDAAGDVFVADAGNNDVVEMSGDATSSSQQVTLPFTGLNGPQGVAVDAKGDVFVADTGNGRVVELPAGSDTPVTLPFTGLNYPTSVGVDAAGDVFALSMGEATPPYEVVVPDQILELPSGSGAQEVLSAAPVGPADNPPVMTVDAAGNVFVGAYGSVDSDDQGFGLNTTVVEVKAGSTTGNVIYSDLTGDQVNGIAVDPVDGDVLVDFSGHGTPSDIGQFIQPEAQPLSVSTASLPGGVAGTAYSQQLATSGGTAPYTWKVTAGSLPGGLALSGNGTISGTPKMAGTATFTVQATDAGNPAQTASEKLSITVVPDQADLAVSMTGPATVTAGGTVTYTLTVTDKGPAPASDVTALLGTSGLTAVTPSAGGITRTVTFFGTKLTGSSWTVASLASGHSDTFTVTGTAPGKASQTASATGGALATTPDPDILNNISLATTKTTK